jgi:hypothetical protein
MDRLEYPATGVFTAAFLAGPIFMFGLLLADYFSRIPAAIPLEPEMLLVVPFMGYTMVIGFLLAIMPCLIGAALMTALSRSPVMRSPFAWCVIGSAIPLTVAWLSWGEWGIPTFALSATGGTCALICRKFAAE